MKNNILKQLKEFYPNSKIGDINEIRYKDGIFVGRVEIDNKNLVVKYFEKIEHAIEIANYKLLQTLGVLTPKIFFSSDNLLVMENINFNPNYHLATAEDLKNKEVITSLARWYKTLHQAGKKIDVSSLYSELDFITIENLKMLQNILPNCENLELMIDNFDKIKNKIDSLPVTITYNDFAEENMIAGKNIAMMYDHNKMGKGLAYFDIQNVSFMLDDDIKRTFLNEYGPIPEIEKLAYELLIPFITLIMASQMPKFPNWALPYKTKAYTSEIKSALLKFIS